MNCLYSVDETAFKIFTEIIIYLSKNIYFSVENAEKCRKSILIKIKIIFYRITMELVRVQGITMMS